MAHLLYRFGEAALRPRMQGKTLLPPLISFANAMKLREEFSQEGV